jgi:nicotinamidase/pyrazinamidase
MARAGQSNALLVIDVQNDFCPGGSLPVPHGDEIVPVINRLMAGFDIVVASQDWHPAGHISFASTHSGRHPFDTLQLEGREQILWPDHCVQGSKGAEFHPDLDIRPVVLIVRKGWQQDLDSYSAFFENDQVTPTGLEAYLKGMGIRRLYLTGLAQDVCVYYSARDALRLGFETFLVEEATRGLDQPRGSLAQRMKELEKSGLRLIRANDIVT